MTGTETLYEFRMRPDLPSGFVENDRIPEVPRVTRFLQQFAGRQFTKPGFEAALGTYQEYVAAHPVEPGQMSAAYPLSAPMIRPYGEEFDVIVRRPGPPGECGFGFLVPLDASRN